MSERIRRFAGPIPSTASLLAGKGTTTIAACIPARDEAATIEPIVATCVRLAEAGLLDEVVVVDDHSTDNTGDRARALGAAVVHPLAGPGKGEALRCAVGHATSDVLVFLDADVRDFTERFVTGLVAPLLGDDALVLVKASYRRPLDGRADEGGRVTELLARPLLERFAPPLASVTQPLAGECAIRRVALDDIWLADGYGVELALLLDVHARFGIQAIAEVDLGERVHRNRPLRELHPHARAALDAVVSRIPSLTPGGTA
jgi:glucosyl-3-phosphoglycerate synthase